MSNPFSVRRNAVPIWRNRKHEVGGRKFDVAVAVAQRNEATIITRAKKASNSSRFNAMVFFIRNGFVYCTVHAACQTGVIHIGDIRGKNTAGSQSRCPLLVVR